MVHDQKPEPALVMEPARVALDVVWRLTAGVVDVERHVVEPLRCAVDRIEVALLDLPVCIRWCEIPVKIESARLPNCSADISRLA